MFDKVVWLFKTAPSRRVFAFFINLYIRGTCTSFSTNRDEAPPIKELNLLA